MITAGGPQVVGSDDGWTISTADGSLAAHFEHTVAITARGPRILTPRVGLPAAERRSGETEARETGFREAEVREAEGGVLG
jgi:hypothetical protein